MNAPFVTRYGRSPSSASSPGSASFPGSASSPSSAWGRSAAAPQTLALLLALTCAGCFEVEDRWTLNPDGSGKVTRQVTLAPRGKSAAEWARWGIERSSGVAAWSEFRSEELPDGRLRLAVTGHFADLQALDLACGPQPFWVGEGQERRIVLSDRRPPETALPLAEGEERASVAERRRRGLRGLLRAYGGAAAASFKTVLCLPGTVGAFPGYARDPSGELSVQLELGAVAERLEALLEDDAFLLERGERRLLGPRVNSLVAGGNLEVRLAGELLPRFDYARELPAALSESDALQDRIGVDAVASGRTLRVVEARVARLAYVQREEGLPWYLEGLGDGFRPHLRLNLVLRLNGKVTDFLGVTLASAQTLAGVELARGEFVDDLSGERDEEDGRVLLLSLPLAYPAAPFRGLAEVSGRVQVTTARETKNRALGFKTLASGESAPSGAQVAELRGHRVTILYSGATPSDVARVRLVRPGGKEVEVLHAAPEGWDAGVSITILAGRELREGEPLDVVLDLYTDKRVVEVPFRLQKIGPTGRLGD